MSFTVGTSFRFTVVVPTHERRELAVSVVQSLARQREAPSFEVVVVVDGSTDGSAHALRRLEPAFPLTVVEQPNRGAAAARNAGASRARGELLLFLDDDMEADRDLIAEHEREHRRGADVVLGHLPLHPGSPRSVLAEGVDCWTQGRVRRLSEPGAKLTLHDLLTGQVSLSRDTFQAIGGFDTSFTRGGSFGGEDIDFGYRLQKAGYRIVFNPAAISWQRYIVGPKQYFRQWRQAGRSDAELSRKHPERAAEIAELAQVTDAWSRLILTRLTATPVLARTATATLSTLVTWLVGSRHRGACTRRLCGLAKKLEYLRGAHQGGGLRGPGLVVVLAYHSVTHLRSDGLLAPYSVTPKELASHLDFLAHEGYRFIDLGELCEALGGAMPLPERGVLLSFDDCYENLRSEALPVLAQRGVPAVTFAVSGRLGGTNDWDRHLGGGNLRLLDADGLREVTQRGIEVGAHSRTHPVLTGVGDTDLLNEVAGSAADLEAVGLPRPRAFAYPYGVSDARVMEAVRKAGYEAAFATAPGVVSQGSDRHGLPRIELSSGDSTLRLRIKLANAAAPSLVRQRFARTVWPTEERWSARFARLLLGRSRAGRLGRLLAHRGAGVGSSTRGPHEPEHPASAP